MADETTTTTETTTTETTAPETKAADTTTTTETKAAETTTETKPAETTETKPDTETKADAPADYTALKLPEGYKADDPVFADAVKLFEGEKIAPDVAQKLIDFTVERDKAIAKAVNDQSAAQWTKQTGEWRANAEKEFSADQLGNAKTALAQVFDKETVAYLEGLGFTNHPGLIRGMVKVSQAIKDDTFVGGNAGRANGALDPKSMYPNTQHN
jgi:hypothetical protein